MGKIILAAVAGATLFVSGCGAISDGVYQKVTVNTNRPNAICEFSRDGKIFSTILSGETAYNVRRGHMPITISCSKRGFQTASATIEPFTDSHGAVLFNFGVPDALIGSNMSYPDSIRLNLPK